MIAGSDRTAKRSAARGAPRSARRCATPVALLSAALISLAAGPPRSAWAQSGSDAGFALCADEENLYLLQMKDEQSAVYHRGVTTAFRSRPPLGDVIVSSAVRFNRLYAFVRRGQMYSLGDDAWRPELNFSHRAAPLDLAGFSDDLYAIIPSPPPGAMPLRVNGQRPPTSQPYDAGDAALTLAAYDARGWIAVAALPADTAVTGAGTSPPPRVAAAYDRVYVFWPAERGNVIAAARLDPNTAAWERGAALPVPAPVEQFWYTAPGRVPTLVVLCGEPMGQSSLTAYRSLGIDSDGWPRWRPAALALSPLPARAKGVQYRGAYGFNQHIALLATDAGGESYVQFARTDDPPAEPTLVVQELLDQRRHELTTAGWIQGLTILALFGLVALLFVFRRDALTQTLPLPEHVVVALGLQRLLALALDLLPFAVLATMITGVDWRGGLRSLLDWALGLEVRGSRLPELATLGWWVLATGAHGIYALASELLAQRTLGKALLGMRVLSERGAPAAPLAIVARNVLRFLELQPPMWVLGFLVLLSRNRQRVGDIFARTIVVRRARRAPPGGADPGQRS